MKIERNIPVRKNAKQNRIDRYQFDKMKVGDSVFVPVNPGIMISSLQSQLITDSRNFCKLNNLDWKFTSRTIDGKGIRIFRIK